MTLQNHDLAVRMAELARVIALRKVDDVLVDVTAAAKELIPGVDVAGVLLVGKGGTFETLAPTSDLMFKLDDLQMRYRRGPVRRGRARRDRRAHRRLPQRAAVPQLRARGRRSSGCSARCRSSSTPPTAPRAR